MTRRERVLAAIQHKEPDKVPKGEIGAGIDEQLIRQLLDKDYDPSGTDDATFHNWKAVRELLHIDLVSVGLDLPPDEPTGELFHGHPVYRDGWGRTYIKAQGASRTVKPVLEDIREVYNWEPPSLENARTDTIRRWVEETDFFIFPCVNGAFEISYEILRFEDFMIWCHTCPREVELWTEKITRHGAEAAKIAVEAGAHGIVIADDLAYNSGTMIAPEMLRSMIFPYLKWEVQQIKELGVPVFLHTDGNINAIMQDIIEMGFDGTQALQPSAGVDIAQIKQDYGDRLCLMGNVDIDLLGRGTPQQIEQAVKELIEVAAPGGGFILSSSNELGTETSVENALAMYRAGERYGVYEP